MSSICDPIDGVIFKGLDGAGHISYPQRCLWIPKTASFEEQQKLINEWKESNRKLAFNFDKLKGNKWKNPSL